jgi:hypothetical protein
MFSREGNKQIESKRVVSLDGVVSIARIRDGIVQDSSRFRRGEKSRSSMPRLVCQCARRFLASYGISLNGTIHGARSLLALLAKDISCYIEYTEMR